jgi:hypothetical protein
MFQHSNFKRNFFAYLHFLMSNMNLTFRIFSIDQLSDICFAEIIYISLLLDRSFLSQNTWNQTFKHTPVSSKMTNIHYTGQNSILKFSFMSIFVKLFSTYFFVYVIILYYIILQYLVKRMHFLTWWIAGLTFLKHSSVFTNLMQLTHVLVLMREVKYADFFFFYFQTLFLEERTSLTAFINCEFFIWCLLAITELQSISSTI